MNVSSNGALRALVYDSAMAKQTSTIASLELFAGLSKAELKKVEGLMTEIRLSAGKELMKEGSPGREAMIITSGTACIRRGGRAIATVGPGDILGEMALLANQNRTATVTAESDLVVEVLNRREFLQLLDEVPTIAKKMLVTAIGRLNQLEPSLAG